MKSATAILRAAIASVKPDSKSLALAGHPDIKQVYSLQDNTIYHNTAAAPGAHRCKIIK